jgi:hypothetical protein
MESIVALQFSHCDKYDLLQGRAYRQNYGFAGHAKRGEVTKVQAQSESRRKIFP